MLQDHGERCRCNNSRIARKRSQQIAAGCVFFFCLAHARYQKSNKQVIKGLYFYLETLTRKSDNDQGKLDSPNKTKINNNLPGKNLPGIYSVELFYFTTSNEQALAPARS
jgi:hypothetical protein